MYSKTALQADSTKISKLPPPPPPKYIGKKRTWCGGGGEGNGTGIKAVFLLYTRQKGNSIPGEKTSDYGYYHC